MTSLLHGTNYEIFVKKFLTNKYSNIWLWNEIPINILHKLNIVPITQLTCDDIGCDILAETTDGIYHFIQCKNYSTIGIDNTINICDLSGFYNFIAEHNLINGIVYYSGCLSSQVIKRAKTIKYINLPYNVTEKIALIPHSYQVDAYNKLSISGRNTLTMPCGTGKTYVSYLLSSSYSNIIVLSPLISTAEQLFSFYKQYYQNTNTCNITIYNCKNKNKNIDLLKRNVIISTYDSVNLIYENVSKLNDKIIIIDEYHNLSTNNLTNNTDYINKLLTLQDTSYLFMSATPHKLKTLYPIIFGSNEYILNWETAIANNYICDYRFYYPNSEIVNNKINEIKNQSIISKLEFTKCILLNKAYYLLECIQAFSLKKIIVFLKTVSESQEFTKIINILNIFFSYKLFIGDINHNTSKSERNKSITRFKNKSDTINILCNVHILDEGIDIPECDSVYLTHPNYNPINFVQRISRCNRLKPNNSGLQNIANVLIWAKNEHKIIGIDKLISEYLKVKSETTNNVYIRNKQLDTIDLFTQHVDNLYKDLPKGYSGYLNIQKNNKFIDTITPITSKQTLCGNDTSIESKYTVNCKYCNKNISSAGSFRKHCGTEQHKKNYSLFLNTNISEESKSAKLIKDIKNSNTEIIQLNKEFKCISCNKIYSNKSNLSRHIKKCSATQTKINTLKNAYLNLLVSGKSNTDIYKQLISK